MKSHSEYKTQQFCKRYINALIDSVYGTETNDSRLQLHKYRCLKRAHRSMRPHRTRKYN